MTRKFTIPTDEPTFVYFARRTDNGHIKIGFTTQAAHRRMQNLRRETGCPIELLAYARGSYADEGKMHARVAPYRYAGEWFIPSKAVWSLVDHVSRTGSLPSPTRAKVVGTVTSAKVPLLIAPAKRERIAA